MNYLIALSGGLDSIVLLDLLRKQYGANCLRAAHVHHGLSPYADAWAEHCQTVCAQWKIPFEVHRVQLERKAGESLEALARVARYNVFARLLQPGETLATAHHQDDQAETFFLHALRGAGPNGLAAMPVVKKFAQGMHWRPLLHLTRAVLVHYANAHQLSWVEDESNANIAFDRNFLRHRILPEIKKRWPKVTENFARTAEIQAELSDLLDQWLTSSWSKMPAHLEQLAVHQLYKQEYADKIFPLSLLEELTPALKNWLLREWLRKSTHVILSKQQLELLKHTVIHAKQDKQPEYKMGDFMLRRYANALWVCTPLTLTEQNQKAQDCLRWISQQCRIPLDALTVHQRQGGERIHLKPHKHSKELKNILNEWRIPPWERMWIPLIYQGEELIGVGKITWAPFACTQL